MVVVGWWLLPASGALPARSVSVVADTDHVGRIFDVIGRREGRRPGHSTVTAADGGQRPVFDGDVAVVEICDRLAKVIVTSAVSPTFKAVSSIVMLATVGSLVSIV